MPYHMELWKTKVEKNHTREEYIDRIEMETQAVIKH